MTGVLSDFIRALRANDVRISAAEAIDAGATLALMGYEDRALLRAALSQALAKTMEEKRAFAETFDRFFAFKPFSDERPPAAEDQDPDHEPTRSAREGPGQDAEDAGAAPGARGPDGPDANDQNPNGQGPDGQGADGPGAEGQGSDAAGSGNGGSAGAGGGTAPPDLAQLLLSGDGARLQMELAEAARVVGLSDIAFFTQRGLYAWRMMDVMGRVDLDRRIARELAAPDALTREAGARLAALRERFRVQVRDYVEQYLALFTANAGRQLREDALSRVRLGNIDRGDHAIMRALMARMARKLVSLHSRRKRIARRGHLDVRRTIRANVEFDGLMFHRIWRRTRIDRPKVVAVCDVSGSVARVAHFLLMFLHSLQEVLPEVRSFVFSSRLGEVTDLFESLDVEDAARAAIARHGGGATDYGRAFMDLEALAMAGIDHRTTVLILGDARSNHGDPRADILARIHDRARRVLFLNPEPRSLWNTGDSVMRRLAPHCDEARPCASLKDLERLIADLMRTAV